MSKSNEPLIITSFARDQSDIKRLVEAALVDRTATVVDLHKKRISSYRYDETDRGDDFLTIAEDMATREVIVFATPVYWYAMSGALKQFFDRLTDLITVRKDLGRALKGAKIYLLVCGTDETLPLGFEEPFRLTADYFDASYAGSFYWQVTKDGTLTSEIAIQARKMF